RRCRRRCRPRRASRGPGAHCPRGSWWPRGGSVPPPLPSSLPDEPPASESDTEPLFDDPSFEEPLSEEPPISEPNSPVSEPNTSPPSSESPSSEPGSSEPLSSEPSPPSESLPDSSESEEPSDEPSDEPPGSSSSDPEEPSEPEPSLEPPSATDPKRLSSEPSSPPGSPSSEPGSSESLSSEPSPPAEPLSEPPSESEDPSESEPPAESEDPSESEPPSEPEPSSEPEVSPSDSVSSESESSEPPSVSDPRSGASPPLEPASSPRPAPSAAEPTTAPTPRPISTLCAWATPGSEPSARPEAAMTASIRRGMKPRPSDRVVTVSASFVRLLRKVWVFHRNHPVACSAAFSQLENLFVAPQHFSRADLALCGDPEQTVINKFKSDRAPVICVTFRLPDRVQCDSARSGARPGAKHEVILVSPHPTPGAPMTRTSQTNARDTGTGATATPATGVQFPADAAGNRSTGQLAKHVVAEALRTVDPAAADRVYRIKDWRKGYIAPFTE